MSGLHPLACPVCGGPPRWAEPFGRFVAAECRRCGLVTNHRIELVREDDDEVIA